MVFDKIKNKTEKTLEDNLPKIKDLFKEKVGPMTKNLLLDDERMRPVTATIYQALPFVVRMVVKEETFTEYCLKNRSRLFKESEQSELIPESTAE